MTNEKSQELISKVEALLFSYGDWMSVSDIGEALGMESDLPISKALKEVQAKYEEGFSFHVETDDRNRWRMSLRNEYQDLVTDLIAGTEIPQPVLKVLSVIAYEQPVTKTRLSEILGKSVNKEVANLYRNKYLSYEKHGNGKYYKVTKKFYDYFKLDEDEDFRKTANKNITTFFEELPTTKEEEIEEAKE